MKLKEILLKKAQAQTLGHFYILETAEHEAHAMTSLVNFSHDFIKEYYQTIEGAKQSFLNLMDHPDVYVLGNVVDDEEKETANFTVEESAKFARFFEFKPVQAKRKFAVITEAHRVSPTVANKWLKLLEEPQGLTTIFLLNPRRMKLLDTINSRALHLRLTAKKQEWNPQDWQDFLADTKDMHLAKFLEKYSKGDAPLSYWMGELVQWEAEQNSRPQSKVALETWLRSYQEMEVFHQPTATKWTLFFSHLQNHVFPRL